MTKWLLLVGMITLTLRAYALSETSGVSPQCEVQILGSLADAEAQQVYAAALACLESHLTDDDVSALSPAGRMLNQILQAPGATRTQLQALSSYLNRAQSRQEVELLKQLKPQFEPIAREGLSACTTDYSQCDFVIHQVMSVVHILPNSVLSLADTVITALSSAAYGILPDSLKLRAQGLKAMARFYAAVSVSRNGVRPQWRIPLEQRSSILADLNETSKNLMGFSTLWGRDVIRSILPIEYHEIYNKILSDDEVAQMGRNFTASLWRLSDVLQGLVLYSDRLTTDFSLWVHAKQNQCQREPSVCPQLLQALILFGEYEVQLPQRSLLAPALSSFAHEWPEVNAFAQRFTSLGEQVEKFNRQFVEAHGLSHLMVGQEQNLALKYPDFSSLYDEAHNLTAMSLMISLEAKTYEENPLAENKARYEASIQLYERRWFALQCASLRSNANDRVSGSIHTLILPFSKIKLAAQMCQSSQFRLAAIENNFDGEMLKLWAFQPIREAGSTIALLATTLAAAALAGPGAAGVSTMLTRWMVASTMNGLAKSLALQSARAMVGSLIFTTSMKLFNAGLGLTPLWNSHQGFYGNIIKPWFIGSVIFFVLPYTATLSAFLSRSLLRPGVAQNVVDVTTTSIGLTVDTVSFALIDYSHRVLERLFHQRKVIFSGDAQAVFTSSFIYAVAFRAVFASHHHLNSIKNPIPFNQNKGEKNE